MRSVLISIQPKWVEKIASGKKTIEVRKTRPKLETPFKCYIYCTKAKEDRYILERHENGFATRLDGKVIGEFVCDKIIDIKPFGLDIEEFEKQSCLSALEIARYLKGLYGYGWHISDLKIYDKPKELRDFKKQNFCYKAGDIDNLGCWEGGCVEQELGWCDGRCSVVEKAPQSWQYVEKVTIFRKHTHVLKK